MAIQVTTATNGLLAVMVVCMATGHTDIAAQLVLLTVGGYLAGLLNTAAGSGGLVSLLAVIATGVPPHAANVANQVATPAGFLPARKRMLAGQASRVAVAGMVAGTMAGSVVLAFMPPGVFQAVAPAVILAAVVLLLVQPWSPRIIAALRRRRHNRVYRRRARHTDLPVVIVPRPAGTMARAGLPAALAGCGLYAGLIGAGVGTLTVMVLDYAMRGKLADAMAARNRVCLLAALAACVTVVPMTLLAGHDVAWLAAGVMAGAMYLGGTHGVRLVEVLRPYNFWLRILIAATSILMAIYLWMH